MFGESSAMPSSSSSFAATRFQAAPSWLMMTYHFVAAHIGQNGNNQTQNYNHNGHEVLEDSRIFT
jgi:hypothetical protein